MRSTYGVDKSTHCTREQRVSPYTLYAAQLQLRREWVAEPSCVRLRLPRTAACSGKISVHWRTELHL